MTALVLLPPTARETLSLSRTGLESGQFWRLWTGHLVHLGPYHAGLNLIGLAVLGLLCPAPQRGREWLRRLLLMAPVLSAAIYFGVPDLDSYVGFSGLLHGLFLLGLVPMARRGDRIAWLCLTYLAGKLAWEMAMGAPLSDEQAIGGRVVTQAHLFGTLAALAYGLAFKCFAHKPGEIRP